MFKRILIATDGSKLAKNAIDHGVALAGVLDAEIIGLTIRAPFPMIYSGEPVVLPASAQRDFDQDTIRVAEKHLAVIEKAATAGQLRCRVVHLTGLSPAESIIAAAKKYKCDLIVMGSHGHRGIKRVLLGSQTNIVLTHSKIPVLVTR